MKRVLLPLILGFLLISCSPSHDSTLGQDSTEGGFVLNPSPDPEIESTAQTILTNSCMNCHGPGGSNTPIFEEKEGKVDMQKLALNSRYISIGRPTASYLYQAIFSVAMPTSAPADSFLESEVDQQSIERWIEDIGLNTGGGDGPTVASFQEVEERVLTPHCYSCHETSSPIFTDYNSVMASMTIANNPDSFFLQVIKRTDPNTRMPKGQDPLSQELIDLVESWIMDGAQNN